MELKHIAPYLPYGLKGNLVNLEYFDSQICCELYRIETGKTKESDKYDITVIVGDCESELKDFKPTLRPLSDLTKEIEHNGERFVPLEEMLRANKHEFKELPLITKCETKIYERDNDTFCTIEYLNNDKSVSSFSYSSQYRRFIDRNETYGKPYATPYQYDLFEMLYKWKFDIFNLIEKGEAIDVNTLQTNPYK